MPLNKDHVFPEKENKAKNEKPKSTTADHRPQWGEMADLLLPLLGIKIDDSFPVPLSPKDLRAILRDCSSSTVSYYVKKWNSLHPDQKIQSPGRGGSKGTWNATHGTWKAFFSYMDDKFSDEDHPEDREDPERTQSTRGPLAALLAGSLLSTPNTDSEEVAQEVIDSLQTLRKLLRLRAVLMGD